MNGPELLRIVDAIHRDKNIAQEIVFEGIEQAIISAARKHFGEESEIAVSIDRETGHPSVNVDETELDTNEIGDLLGRIAAQTAKQVMIQKIREAERDALYEEYTAIRGQIVTGSITQASGGAATVNLGKVEALLPRGEQIPGEYHRVGERVRAIVLEVKKAGSRVRIILSRTHPQLVRRLFELEIPEVAEHVIEVRSLAREAGYRSKVAVSCYDNKIDCVGACVGVRGSRIKNVVEELAGERIDIVRWNDSLTVLVPNALQPAEVEDVILCPMLGKVIVLVHEDQLSLSIGKKGQNVRLASKLVGWDIHVLTQEKLDERLDEAVTAFSAAPGVTEELAENLVAQGFFTFDDLSVIEPDQLAELGGLSEEECNIIVEYADVESLKAEVAEKKAREEARVRRAEEAKLAAAAPAVEAEKETSEKAEGKKAEGKETESEETEKQSEAEKSTGDPGSGTDEESESAETESKETAIGDEKAAAVNAEDAEQVEGTAESADDPADVGNSAADDPEATMAEPEVRAEADEATETNETEADALTAAAPLADAEQKKEKASDGGSASPAVKLKKTAKGADLQQREATATDDRT
ncbi:MAG: transcription termination factor NusA [Planctomycetes bacterium]|nr:transcription termination factor NusA [Planctomycetota bacterium]